MVEVDVGGFDHESSPLPVDQNRVLTAGKWRKWEAANKQNDAIGEITAGVDMPQASRRCKWIAEGQSLGQPLKRGARILGTPEPGTEAWDSN